MRVDAFGVDSEVGLKRVDGWTGGRVDGKIRQTPEKGCRRAAQGDGVEIASVHEAGSCRDSVRVGRRPEVFRGGLSPTRVSTIGTRIKTEGKPTQTDKNNSLWFLSCCRLEPVCVVSQLLMLGRRCDLHRQCATRRQS